MNNILQDLRRSNAAATRYLNQIASGKRINTPSDDPVGTARALRLRATLAQNEQYIDNTRDGSAWLDQTDIALGEINAVLVEAKELAVYGAGGTLPAESMEALANKADQLLEHLIQVGNTTYGDRFIFAGQDTRVKPFTADAASPTGVSYQGDTGSIPLEVSWGVAVDINVTGQAAFLDTGALQALKDLSQNLHAGNTAALSGAVLGGIDAATNKILALRANVGAMAKRLEMNESRLADNNISVTKLLSSTEDADIPEVAMNLSQIQYTYQATLAVGAKILPPTLVDFLR